MAAVIGRNGFIPLRRTTEDKRRNSKWQITPWYMTRLVLILGIFGLYYSTSIFVTLTTETITSHIRSRENGALDQKTATRSSYHQQKNLQPEEIATIREKEMKCRYNGNCPHGSACEVNKQGTQECLPYTGLATSVDYSEPFRTCLQACLKELHWDEMYFYGSVPDMVQSYKALNGHGCVVEYQRSKARVDKASQIVSMDEWMNMRNHHVVRVDPYIPKSTDESNISLWRALCDDPCQIQNDCPNGLICTSRNMQNKTCQTPIKTSPHDMVIVTGADTVYFQALKNFAGSLKYWGPQYPLVVYNLGMTNEELDKVRSWSNLLALKWPNGIPSTYPDHVRDNLKNYAWKPIVINETVHEYKSIFWLDAGATFVGPIEPIEHIVRQHGIFLVKGQDESMKRLSHPGTYEWFGYNKTTFEGGPHYAGNTQGHLFPSRYIDTVVIPNAICALNESCVSPPGSRLRNHRYDQTTLSILAYHKHVQAPHYTEYLAADRSQLKDDLAEHNRFVFWTARGNCEYYADRIVYEENVISTGNGNPP